MTASVLGALTAGLTAAGTTPDDSKVSPGIAGFLAIFAVALATILLIRSMVGHLRKVRYSPGPDDGEPQQPGPGAPPAPPARAGQAPAEPPADTR